MLCGVVQLWGTVSTVHSPDNDRHVSRRHGPRFNEEQPAVMHSAHVYGGWGCAAPITGMKQNRPQLQSWRRFWSSKAPLDARNMTQATGLDGARRSGSEFRDTQAVFGRDKPPYRKQLGAAHNVPEPESTITFFSKEPEGVWGASSLPGEGCGISRTFQPLFQLFLLAEIH